MWWQIPTWILLRYRAKIIFSFSRATTGRFERWSSRGCHLYFHYDLQRSTKKRKFHETLKPKKPQFNHTFTILPIFHNSDPLQIKFYFCSHFTAMVLPETKQRRTFTYRPSIDLYRQLAVLWVWECVSLAHCVGEVWQVQFTSATHRSQGGLLGVRWSVWILCLWAVNSAASILWDLLSYVLKNEPVELCLCPRICPVVWIHQCLAWASEPVHEPHGNQKIAGWVITR